MNRVHSTRARRLKICIRFGAFEGECSNVAGTPWSIYWCARCNTLRMDHISASLAAMVVSE